jgi:peptidoglycan/LPS O-acetylase OafA/YrhL
MSSFITPLHYLRGLAALGIVLHHYFGYIRTADHLHERVGIYGVSIFYVLSGIALYHVYHERLSLNKKSLSYFYLRRFFRIYPLMCVALIATLFLSGNDYSWTRIALNFSGLFSWIDSSAGIPKGVWSIGNELVFYTLFPLLLWPFRCKSKWPVAVFVLITILALFYSMNLLVGESKLDQETWNRYIQPWNQIYLFMGGMLVAYWLKGRRISASRAIIGLAISFALFAFLPVGGDSIHLIQALPRLIFSLLCFGICACLYIMPGGFTGIGHRALFTLGTISYSLYLLHPVVSGAIIYIESLFFQTFDVYLLGFIAFIPALVVAWLSYRIIEAPVLKWAKRFR